MGRKYGKIEKHQKNGKGKANNSSTTGFKK